MIDKVSSLWNNPAFREFDESSAKAQWALQDQLRKDRQPEVPSYY